MRLVAGEPNATYVTIHLGEIYIADNIKEQSFGLDGRLDELLPALREACEAWRFTYFPDIVKPPRVVLLPYTGRLFVYCLLFMGRFKFTPLRRFTQLLGWLQKMLDNTSSKMVMSGVC